MKEETVVVNDNTSDTKANKEISNKTINKNNKIENKSIEK